MCQTVLIMFICTCSFNFNHWQICIQNKDRKFALQSIFVLIFCPWIGIFIQRDGDPSKRKLSKGKQRLKTKTNSHVKWSHCLLTLLLPPMSSNGPCRWQKLIGLILDRLKLDLDDKVDYGESTGHSYTLSILNFCLDLPFGFSAHQDTHFCPSRPFGCTIFCIYP